MLWSHKSINSPSTTIPTAEKDVFGFYSVGDYETYSKLEAIEKSKEVNKPFFWNFNEYETNHFDWTVEPTESLDELYRQRAQEIRDKYDYVVLMFSGGRDSSNIFHAFTSNNIKLDEIVSYKYDGGIEDSLTDFGDTKYVHPKLKAAYAAGYPYKIKQRQVDLSEIVKQYNLFSHEDMMNRAYMHNSHYSVSHYAKSFMREFVPEFRQIMNSSKRLCIVWGCDKPVVARWRDMKGKWQWGVSYRDNQIDSCIPINTQHRRIPEEYDELFYWGSTPTSLRIVSKQAYSIARVATAMDLAEVLNIPPKSLLTRLVSVYHFGRDDPIKPEHWNKISHLGLPLSTLKDLNDWIIYPTSYNPHTEPAVAKSGWTKMKVDGTELVYANKFLSMRDVRWQADEEYKKHFSVLNHQLSQHREYWRDPAVHFAAGQWQWCMSKMYTLGSLNP
jgi:hypothetical protein